MNEEKKDISLREAIARGFENESASAGQEENAGAPAEHVVQEESGPEGVNGVETKNETPNPDTQNAGQTQNSQIVMDYIQRILAENQRLNAEVQSQKEAISQQSAAAEQAIESTVTEPSIDPLNFSELQYMSEDEQAQAVANWQNQMTANVLSRVQKEFEPIKNDYEQKRRNAEDVSARQSVFSDSRFADIRDDTSGVDRILEVMPELSQMEPQKKYIIAGLMARGIKNDPANTSVSNLVEMVKNNPEAMKALEEERLTGIQNNNNSIPTIMASAGLNNANPLPKKEAPKSMAEVGERLKKSFAL